MVLILGVARALKAMHQYRVKGGPGGPGALKKAKAVRQEGADADRDAMRNAKQRSRRKGATKDHPDSEPDQRDVEEEPLMDGEVTRSQEGVAEGEIRPYSHRDIKPGPSRNPHSHVPAHYLKKEKS